jgi:hypothetical protein
MRSCSNARARLPPALGVDEILQLAAGNMKKRPSIFEKDLPVTRKYNVLRLHGFMVSVRRRVQQSKVRHQGIEQSGRERMLRSKTITD